MRGLLTLAIQQSTVAFGPVDGGTTCRAPVDGPATGQPLGVAERGPGTAFDHTQAAPAVKRSGSVGQNVAEELAGCCEEPAVVVDDGQLVPGHRSEPLLVELEDLGAGQGGNDR
jgi:hypothetical protein